MKISKIILSFVLIAAMVMSLLSYFSFAEDINEPLTGKRRLYEEERSLYEKIWLNEDGTRTLEYYGSPVKYYDKDGNLLDKEYKIYETSEGFIYEEDFKVLFPFSLTDSVKLIFENEEVTMSPCDLENIKRPYLSEDNRVLTYEINDNVSIEYLISDIGVKEYIVVNEYDGITEYSSVIGTNGLVIEDGLLLNGEEEIKAYIGEAIVFDKEENNNTFADTETSLISESRYLYTISLTEEYLNRAEYPIRIDPSITLNTTGNIEDVSIVSTTTHSGTSGVLYVGRGSSGAALRALMRFPNLNLETYNVLSATVSIRDLMCEHASMDLECHEYTGGSWSENTTTTWSQCGTNMVGALCDSHEVYYGLGNHSGDSQRYDFDITALAKLWSEDPHNHKTEKGLLFKAPDTYETQGSKTYKSFGSINYNSNGTYYKPCLTIVYSLDGVYTIRNASTLYYAWSTGNTSGDSTYQRDYDYGQYSNWLVEYVSNGYYRIRSTYSGLFLGASSSSNGASVNIYSTESDATKWKILPTTAGNYKIIAKCSEANNLALKPQGSSWGHALKQYTYTDDNDYLDEWILQTDYHLSGYELTYEPERWNSDSIRNGTNCYMYALNTQLNHNGLLANDMDPGDAALMNLHSNMITASVIINYIFYDSVALDFYFDTTPIDYYEQSAYGTYKIALVIDEYTDYHFYRQNPDGTWSHKLDDCVVTNRDASGNIIYDPRFCDRDYSNQNGANYDIFAGFFSVSPLNNYYGGQ